PLDDLMAHSNKLKAEGCRLETDLTELTAKFGTRSGPGQAGAGR
ncbi:unnamed protein product, partial [marine sediment metagenome]